MSSLNRATLVGNLGRDPEIRTTQAGDEVAKQYLRKGSKALLEGQLQTRKYTDASGVERYSTEVVLQRFRGTLVLLGDGRGGTAPDPDSYGTTRPAGAGSTAPVADRDDGGLDDEIPF